MDDQSLFERMHFIPEWRQDPYQINQKWREPSVCPDCGAVYKVGRWSWPLYPEDGERRTCPACRRIREGNPAGFLTIQGDLYLKSRKEIELLVAHFVERERSLHPLKRMIGQVRLADGSRLLTFTEPHLAARVGEAIYISYRGEMRSEYKAGDYLIRMDLIIRSHEYSG